MELGKIHCEKGEIYMFYELAKERFSCRNFCDKKVEEKKLEKILEVGNMAPTAKNLQPHRIYVLESKDALEKLDSVTHIRRGAPIVLLFSYDCDEDWKNPYEEGIHSGIQDVSIVATHIMMEAKELGLDSCWCNAFPNSKIEEAFNLPKNEKVVLLLPIGYKSDDAIVSQNHFNKKDLKDIVRRL